MIEVLEDMPDGVVGVEAVGEVTANDYETVLIPTFETGRAAHDHLNVVFVAGERFTGLLAAARCGTTSSGAPRTPRGGGGSRWSPTSTGCATSPRRSRWLAPKGMKVFPTTELDAAKAWAAG